jgi:hypothetical protein
MRRVTEYILVMRVTARLRDIMTTFKILSELEGSAAGRTAMVLAAETSWLFWDECRPRLPLNSQWQEGP